jgi:hypothetical protein
MEFGGLADLLQEVGPIAVKEWGVQEAQRWWQLQLGTHTLRGCRGRALAAAE